MNDMKLFDRYRKDWTRTNGSSTYCSVDHLLRFWKENKAQYLAPLFGEDLILERDIVYDKPYDVIRNEMYNVMDKYERFLCRVVEKLATIMGVDTYGWNAEDRINDIVWRNLRHCIQNAGAMTENKLELGYDGYLDNGEGPNYIKQYNLDLGNGKKINLQRGMKTTRALTAICKAFGWEQEWEEFRIAHSQVLNTKRMTGTLCLSIHPLDYATASDNDNGWSSCMSWQDYGCYRMGTVEMMNSPMVICAYLKSKKQAMEIDGQEWNSKKWRAWIIVTKDVIVCNRHYPYHMDEMAIQCINWVRDLVGEKYGWKYEEPKTNFYGWMRDEADYELEFHTNYMYNDLGGDDVVGCFKEGWKPRNMPGVINFSGPAECMICGDEIYPDSQDAGQLECDDCWCENRCEECGESLGEDDIYHDPDGHVLCWDCYDRICTTCPCCDQTAYRDDMTNVVLPMRENWKDMKQEWKDLFKGRNWEDHRECYNGDFQWMIENEPYLVGEVDLCEDCCDRYGVKEVEYEEGNEYNIKPGTYMVIDPTEISIRKALNVLNAPGYEYAKYAMERIERGRWHNCDPDEAREYYGAIVDFWTERWTQFQKEFEDHKNL